MGSTSHESENDQRYASVTDEKKRKRMISNRDSARRSRLRKQKLLSDLVNEVTVLKNDNATITKQVDEVSKRYDEMEAKNNVLRAQAMELTERLNSLNSVIEMLEGINGEGLELDVPESMMNPWQMNCCPMQTNQGFC